MVEGFEGYANPKSPSESVTQSYDGEYGSNAEFFDRDARRRRYSPSNYDTELDDSAQYEIEIPSVDTVDADATPIFADNCAPNVDGHIVNVAEDDIPVVGGKRRIRECLKMMCSSGSTIEESPKSAVPATVNVSESEVVADVAGRIFTAKGRKYEASGRLTDDGSFRVITGTSINPAESPLMPLTIKTQRDELILAGTVKDFVFVEDYVFKTASAAAGTIYGTHINATRFWKGLGDAGAE